MSAHDLTIRPITTDESAAWLQAVSRGFAHVISDEDAAADAVTRGPVQDPERVWAGFDGDDMVATYRSFATTLSMPGGHLLPTSAVTGVTTTSTHRRRGLATRLVVQDLHAAKERGEQAAVLLAAEWPIYGRFGFGPATDVRTLTLHTHAAMFTRPPVGTVRIVSGPEARVLAPAIFARHRAVVAGEIDLTSFAWDLDFGLVTLRGFREAKPEFHAVAYSEGGEPAGYVRYRVEEGWVRNQPAGSATVSALIGVDANAQALLWKHVADHDFVATVKAETRAVDDVLPWLVSNPRDVEVSDESDFLWVRPLDVPGVLAGRTYQGSDGLVLEVVDRLDLAAGRFALDVADGQPAVAPTTRLADVTMPVDMLGGLLLGGRSAVILHEAGRIDEHTEGSVIRLDALLRTARAPWCSVGF